MKAGTKETKNLSFLPNMVDQYLTPVGGLITFKQLFNNQE